MVANGRGLVDRAEQLVIIEVMAAFLGYARVYYRRPDGTPTSEYDNFCQALRPLKKPRRAAVLICRISGKNAMPYPRARRPAGPATPAADK